jgi:hypothetical protein
LGKGGGAGSNAFAREGFISLGYSGGPMELNDGQEEKKTGEDGCHGREKSKTISPFHEWVSPQE